MGIMKTRYRKPNQTQLRGLGVDLPDMVSRHASSDEMVAQVGRAGAEAAGSYVTALDALRQLRLMSRATLREGHGQVDALLVRVRVWRKTLLCSGEAFEAGDLEPIAAKPREVLSYAAYLLEAARERASRLPYARAMIADLERHLEPARDAWQAAHWARVELKAMQRDVRSKGQALQRSVMQLRVVLDAKLGKDHPDCRLLKVTRRHAPSRDDHIGETPAASHASATAVAAPDV
jgi:hypothetical protein